MKKDVFVYFLLKDKKIVYVGQTTNGFERIKQHLLDYKKDFDDYKILKCEESELDELENKYIIKYNPKYNSYVNPISAKHTYIERKLKEKIGFNPYSINFIKKIIHKSCFKKEMFKNDEVILKKEADLIIEFLIKKYNSFYNEMNDYFKKVTKGE
jgi:hypothetical protein